LLASSAPPCTGNYQLEGDEYFAFLNRFDLSAQDFTGPVGFDRHNGYHGRDGGAILVESWEDGALTHEGLF
jgi:hypothetical protein